MFHGCGPDAARCLAYIKCKELLFDQVTPQGVSAEDDGIGWFIPQQHVDPWNTVQVQYGSVRL